MEELSKALYELERRGVLFFIHVPYAGGEKQFSAEEMSALLTDADAFYARYHKLSPQDWAAYLAWLQSGLQCTAVMSNGERCPVPTSGDMRSPGQFRRGITDRCIHHGENSDRLV